MYNKQTGYTMRKKWIFYFIGGLLASPCYAQDIAPSILNAGGGTAVTGGNIHEWSVGEMVLVETATAGANTVTQGVLQPIYVDHTDIHEETAGLQDAFVLYPNPTNGQVLLQPYLGTGTTLDLTLVDLTGKVLSKRQVVLYGGNEAQSLDLNAYASGMYILSVQWMQDGTSKNVSYRIEKR